MSLRIFSFFILRVLIAFVVTHGQAPNCEKEKQKCTTNFASFNGPSLFSVATEKELRTFCNIFEQFIDCRANYLQACGDLDDPLGAKQFIPISRLMNTICTPKDPFIPRFLEFTACYPKFAIDYNSCLYNFVQDLKRSGESSSTSVMSKYFYRCCNLEEFLHCTTVVTQNKCGKAVADIGEEVNKKIMGDELLSLCSVYKYDSPQCSFLRNATVPGASSPEVPNECQLSQRCTTAILYWRTNDFFFAVTEDQLTAICESANVSKACVEKRNESCGTTPEISEAKSTISLVLGLINAVCKPGDQFRQRYLLFTNSYPNFAAELKVCDEQELANKKITEQMEMPEYNKRAKLCCDYETAKHCQRTAIVSKSGKVVADIAMEVFRMLDYKVVERFCSPFRNNNPECPSSYSSNPSAVTNLTTATSATSASTTTATSAPSASTTKHVNIPLPLLYILVLFQTSMS